MLTEDSPSPSAARRRHPGGIPERQGESSPSDLAGVGGGALAVPALPVPALSPSAPAEAAFPVPGLSREGTGAVRGAGQRRREEGSRWR